MTDIGVVIPVRDGERFLGEALDSLALQVPRSAEVVVVDDGSTDASVAVAQARGVRVIAAAGSGPGAARNTGAAALATPLLAFLDADDRFTPQHHATLRAALDGVDGARGRVRVFAQDAGVAGRFVVPATPARGGVAGTLILRRTAFEAAGGFGTDEALHESFELFSRLAETGARIVDVEAVVLERRIHGENLTVIERGALHARYLASARAAIERRRA